MSIVEAFSLLGGVGLFLFGMTIMSAGLKNACGDKLQTILEHATKNKLPHRSLRLISVHLHHYCFLQVPSCTCL